MNETQNARLTRRRLIQSLAGVCAGLIAVTFLGPVKETIGRSHGPVTHDKLSSPVSKPERDRPQILSTALIRCRTCGRLTGYIRERFNGTLPVFCLCPKPRGGRKRSRNPSMVSLAGDRATWSPVSDYVSAEGITIHVPYFVGFFLNQPRVGFPLIG